MKIFERSINPRLINRLSREEMKERLLKDILCDMSICKIEGWDCMEYLRDLKNLIDHFINLNKK